MVAQILGIGAAQAGGEDFADLFDDAHVGHENGGHATPSSPRP
jgi:hypothetical protein